MAEPEAPTIDLTDSSHDFAKMAIMSLTEDSESPAPQVEKAAVAKEVAAESKASKIPANLFDSPAEKKAVAEPVAEVSKSELDSITKPDFKTPKAGEQWDALHTKAKGFEKQAGESAKLIADLQAKLVEAEGKTKQGDEAQTKYAEMERKHNDAMELVRKVNIDLDPEFRSKYVDGRNALVKQARTIVEESGGNPDDIQTALSLKGKSQVDALAAVADPMNSFQQGRLGRIVDALAALDDEAASKRSSPDEYLKQREEFGKQERLRLEDERGKHMSVAFTDAFDSASRDIEVLRRTENMPDWNKQGEDIAARAREKWQTNKDATFAARKFIEAEAMPVYRQLFLDQREENKGMAAELASAKAELTAIHGNRPGMRSKSGVALPDGKGMDWAQRTAASMAGTEATGN